MSSLKRIYPSLAHTVNHSFGDEHSSPKLKRYELAENVNLNPFR